MFFHWFFPTSLTLFLVYFHVIPKDSEAVINNLIERQSSYELNLQSTSTSNVRYNV